MFAWWGRTAVRARWLILIPAVAVAVIGVLWGTGVFNTLAAGGFDDPNSESLQASHRIATDLGQHDADILVLYSGGTANVDDAQMRDPVVATVAEVRKRPEVASVVTYYDTKSPALVSHDRHSTYAVVSFKATDDTDKQHAYEAIKDVVVAPGVQTHVGGIVAFQDQADAQTKKDIVQGEAYSMPVVLVLLVLIFGGVAAASMPLLIGGLSILAAFTTIRLITLTTDVSTFAANTITLLGLGMAIDYSLFMVSRFREELASGRTTSEAVQRTMQTAGRTILVSGLTIVLALSGLLIFPQVFLRSMGMGGMAAVGMAMIASLTVLPAMFAILGTRINSLRIPLPWRRSRQVQHGTGREGGWARLAHSVMRRPVIYIVVILAFMAVLAAPFLHAKFSGADEKVVPRGTESRVVTEQIATDFPGGSAAPITTFVSGASSDQVQTLVQQIRALPQIQNAQQTLTRGNAALITVSYKGPRTGTDAYDAVRAIRKLPRPAGVEVLVGGRSAMDVDRLASLGGKLPWMALIVAAATLLLLFLAFGSVLLPIQAVVTNMVSIAASLGVLIWIFQDGHLSGFFDFTPSGLVEPTIPVLILVILFGLSTDYEVFLISRAREEWDATGDHRASVAGALQRTGRIITAAALLLVVVVAGFATGKVVFAKMIGVGMIVAVVLDASLVRAMLVPAIMRLLGRATWWAPRPLRVIYQRFGIREEPSEPHEPAPATQLVAISE